jgi:hypothetical protein
MSEIGTLVARITADTSDLERGVGKAQDKLEKLGKLERRTRSLRCGLDPGASFSGRQVDLLNAAVKNGAKLVLQP